MHKGPANHNLQHRDLWLHARPFHTAAKTLAGSLGTASGPLTEFDLSPVVFMYRHALELHLEVLVLGKGGNFLATKPDVLSIHKTHSLPWLAQFVCQIVTTLKWEKEFRCDGIDSLADFRAVVEELNAVDPGSYVFRLPVGAEGQDSAAGHFKPTIREFARRLDALLQLLDSTADALAAEWDLRSDAERIEVAWNGGGVEPTIQ